MLPSARRQPPLRPVRESSLLEMSKLQRHFGTGYDRTVPPGHFATGSSVAAVALYPTFTPFAYCTFYERAAPVAQERNPTAPNSKRQTPNAERSIDAAAPFREHFPTSYELVL